MMISIEKHHQHTGRMLSNATAREERLGTLIIVFAALILLEGVLRKWLLPSIQQPLLFVREPVLLLIYFFYARDYGARRQWFAPYIIFSVSIVTLSLLQALYWNYPLLVPFLGARFYLLYIPLAFIMPEVMTPRQMGRLIRFLLWASIPVGILVFAQFSMPVAHPINKGLSDDIEGRFTVVKDIVRPYGPFTFVSGQAHFAAMMLGILAVVSEKRQQFNISPLLFLTSGAGILTMGALSGGRTYFGFAILVIVSYFLAGFTSPRTGNKGGQIIRVAAIVTLFIATFVLVFPKAYESMSQRQASAIDSEGSTLDRVIRGFTDVAEPFGSAPLFGYGLGAGSNAARLVSGADNGFSLGETEWIRMINEIGPVFGILVLGLRVFLVLWLGHKALASNRRTGDSAALLMFGFAGYLLLAGQITLQNQLVSICWLCVGLVMTFIRLAERQT